MEAEFSQAERATFPHNCPGREFFVRNADRVLFGSDFPNIPYEYKRQVEALLEKKLGTEIEDKIFFKNAEALLS